MSVATHLGIETKDYDRQILTFIPHYAEMLDAAAGALEGLDREAVRLLDLGTGTGALAARCAARLKGVEVVGIDSDGAMLALAARRLGRRFRPVVDRIETARFPACDVVTASFSLHHIPAPETKREVFSRAFAALRPGGLLLDVDSMVNADPRRQARDYAVWRQYLAAAHGRAAAARILKSWAAEDSYFPLDLETALLRDAGFAVDLVWRRDAFAVLAASKPRRRAGR